MGEISRRDPYVGLKEVNFISILRFNIYLNRPVLRISNTPGSYKKTRELLIPDRNKQKSIITTSIRMSRCL